MKRAASIALVLAVLCAVSVAAIEEDLAGWSFGWHQIVAVLTVVVE